ncbi:hypothetical protein SNF32_06930 [Enterococcus mundtii]|nr:hypothetical protein [Enterococcus mundtii]
MLGEKIVTIFDELVQNNTYPIVFIGSGISKRYLKNFPSWLELLEQFWQEIEEEDDFYSYLTEIRESLPSELTDNEKTLKLMLALQNSFTKNLIKHTEKKDFITLPIFRRSL